MIYTLKLNTNTQIEKFFNKAMDELEEFYEITWNQNRPGIILCPDRKSIDVLKGYKTEEWVIG